VGSPVRPNMFEHSLTRPGRANVLCTQEGKRGETVLHEAVNRLDMDVVKTVVGVAALDINLQTYDRLTALDMAISRRWSAGQQVLVQAGARTAEVGLLHATSDEQSDMDWLVLLLLRFKDPHNVIFNSDPVPIRLAYYCSLYRVIRFDRID